MVDGAFSKRGLVLVGLLFKESGGKLEGFSNTSRLLFWALYALDKPQLRFCKPLDEFLVSRIHYSVFADSKRHLGCVIDRYVVFKFHFDGLSSIFPSE